MSSKYGAASAPFGNSTHMEGTAHADLAHISFDPKLTQKIMAKRQSEMTRRAKLLDPRKRAYGVSHEVLDDQICQKRAAQEAAAEEDTYHARTAVLQEQVMQACEEVKKERTKDKKIATMQYSLENCRREQRREFALSDNTELKKEKPLQWEDIEKLGPSSMLKYKGDSNDVEGDKHKKHMETRAWLKQQMADKQDRIAKEKAMDQKFDQEMMFANQVRGICDHAAKHDARQEKMQEAQDNLLLAEQHRERRQNRLDKHIEGNDRHVLEQMTSDRMMETHDYVIGNTGRLLKTEYKRLSQQEVQDVFNVNAMQVLDKKNRAIADKSGDKDAQGILYRGVEVQQLIEQEKHGGVRERRMEAERENRAMAQAKRDQDAHERRQYKSFEHEELPPRASSSLW